MRTILRRTYIGLVWLFFAAVVVQFFLAGLGVFVSPRDFRYHAMFGGIILLIGLLGLIFSFAARLPWRTTGLTGLLPVLVLVQSTLVEFWRQGVLLVGAFHVINALIVFSVAGYMALRARTLAGDIPAAAHTPVEATAPIRAPHKVA